MCPLARAATASMSRTIADSVLQNILFKYLVGIMRIFGRQYRRILEDQATIRSVLHISPRTILGQKSVLRFQGKLVLLFQTHVEFLPSQAPQLQVYIGAPAPQALYCNSASEILSVGPSERKTISQSRKTA